MTQALFKLFGSIEKVEEQDDGTIKVFGIASSEARDGAGEIVSAEAMRDALPDYSRFPALREMHQPLAAGKVLEAEVDADGVTNIVAHVVDPVAIVKVRTGVYLGFSIGGKVLKRDPADRTIITALRLVEISLVDSPCNPDAVLSMWKADTMSEFKPNSADVITRAKKLAKAAGHPRFKECLFEASQELMSEHLLKNDMVAPPAATEPAAAEPEVVEAVAEVDPPAAVVDAEPAAVEPEAVVEPSEPGAEGADAVEPEAIAEPEEIIEAAATIDPAAALAAAIVKGNETLDGATEPTEDTEPFADFGKVSAALKGLGLEGDLAKGLYSVSRFADLLQSFAYLQECVACEASCEQDGSAIPAQLRDAIANLGTILIAMTQEEVAELLAQMGDEGGPEFIYCGEEVELAGRIVDLVKADTDLMAKTSERVIPAPAAAEPIEGEADVTAKAAQVPVLEAEVERLTKALADAAPAVDDLTKRMGETIDGLKDEVAELRKRFEDEPMPAKTGGPAARRVVAKGQDSLGAGAEPNGATLTQDQIDEAWSKMSDAEKGELLVKVALSNPTAIALPTVNRT